jgi:hypothetical protein
VLLGQRLPVLHVRIAVVSRTSQAVRARPIPAIPCWSSTTTPIKRFLGEDVHSLRFPLGQARQAPLLDLRRRVRRRDIRRLEERLGDDRHAELFRLPDIIGRV